MRTKIVVVALVMVASICLGGCVTSAVVERPYHAVQGNTFTLQFHPSADASAQGMALLRNDLNMELRTRGVLADEMTPDTRVLDVDVTYYRMRPGAARALVGIMAGRDKIESSVTVKGFGGKVLSQYVVTSTNATAWGTSHGLIEKHAKEIVDNLVK